MGGEIGSIVIGWRDALLLLVGAVAVYMAIVVLRMRRLKAPPPAMPATSAEQAAPALSEETLPPVLPEQFPGVADSEASPAAAVAPPPESPIFVQDAETEVILLREEVDALRAEVAALRDELHHELAHLRATQTVSPLYSDAMQMATLGHDAATIAERCGISRAEAELMLALIKNQEQ